MPRDIQIPRDTAYGPLASRPLGILLPLGVAVAAWEGTTDGIAGWHVLSSAQDSTIIADAESAPKVAAYVQAHYQKMGGEWVNPLAIIAVQEVAGTGLLAHTIRGRHPFQIRQFQAAERDELMRKIGLTSIGSGVHISMADTVAFDRQFLHMASGRTFTIDLEAWPALVQIADASGWLPLTTEGGRVNPTEITAIINDVVFYRGGFQHPVRLLTPMAKYLLGERAWFDLDESRRVNPLHVGYINAPEKGPASMGLDGTFMVSFDGKLRDSLIRAINKAKAQA